MSDDPVIAAFRHAAEDRCHGATEIERQLITDLLGLEALWSRQGLAAGGSLLAQGQPSMAAVACLAERAVKLNPHEFKFFLEDRRTALRGLRATLTEKAMPWIEEAARVVSISRSSAVAAVVEEAWARDWPGMVVVLEGTSAGCGRDQAEDLNRHGRALSQPDAYAQRWLDSARTLVMVGADAVGSEHFVNCIGTGALLESAALRGVSVVLVADRGKDVPESTILRMVADSPLHRDDTGRQWPIFEMVPMDLVTARISD